jgi:hypothetical protein
MHYKLDCGQLECQPTDLPTKGFTGLMDSFMRIFETQLDLKKVLVEFHFEHAGEVYTDEMMGVLKS